MNSLSDRKRFAQIVSILRKHQLSKGVDPIKLREILEDLGPTFIKIGQIMSSREDIFSERYCKELVKLRDEVAPISYETIYQVLTNEFKQDPKEVFSSIKKEPLGSASIAQVHQATLKNGDEVVIKIQRPNIYEMMKRDISLIRRASKLLKLSKMLGDVVDINAILDEFWNAAKEEMDFNIEALSTIQFSKTYQDVNYLKIPKIYQEYTSSKVLVMEYIGGFDVDDKEGLNKAGYDLKEIADKLAENYITQILDDGFFHADPHCGNIKILDGKICWIDFGMMGTLGKHDKDILSNATIALLNNNVSDLCDCILQLGIHDNDLIYPQFLNDMEGFVSSYLKEDLLDIDLPLLLQDIFNICHKHRIQMPKSVTMLARGLVSIESTLRLLNPQTNVLSIIYRHIMSKSKFDLEKEVKKTGKQIYDASNNLLSVPNHTNDILKMLKRGQFKINLDLMDSKEPLHQLDKMINRLIVVIFAAALLVGSSLICTTDMEPKIFSIPAIGFIGYIAAIIMGIWLFLKMLSIHNQDK